LKTPLHIVLFDGSFKATPFINRLAKGLAATHVVYIFGFNTQLKQQVPGVRYLALGSSDKPFALFTTTLSFAFRKLFRSGDLRAFANLLKQLILWQHPELKQHNFNTAISLLKPDILHVQWPSLLPWCEEALETPALKVVLSQRGYQSNVRPFVDEENLKYLREIYPKLAGFHSVSEATSREGDKIFAGEGKIDHVVYSGFNLQGMDFPNTYTRHEPLRLVSVGRPHWIKGYVSMLLACKFLKEKLPFTYTIVGAAGDEELTYLIEDHGLQQLCTLTPKIGQDAVYKLMKESDLLVLPSLSEGMPNVIIEAMALGLPVLSTASGGVAELIIPDETGWIVPVDDPKAMTEAIEAFTNVPPEKIEAVRLAARKKVEQQHNEKQMVERMERLYREVRSGKWEGAFNSC
jgi:colanic acid/amylovoran biosynthesis glycosyltransferase